VAERSTLPELTPRATSVVAGDTVAQKYLIDSVVGVGGMGVVYLARHLQLGGRLALKFLSVECVHSPEAIERFRREAQAAAQLHSEHVVRVFDVGTHTNGLPYMVMEYLEGRDLGRIIQHSGALSSDVTASLLIQTCSALDEAHRHGIIHRDLKPSNLFCVQRSDGTLAIKVVDFGISKVTGEAASLEQGITITGHIIGSPSYMSPEQMKTPNRIDHRSDIWQLGVVLYECLTGHLPFPASTYAEICLKVHQDAPLPASEHGVELPPGLQAVIDRCLAKEPEQRFQTASDLAAALWEYAPHLPRARVPSMSGGDGRDRAPTPRAPSGSARASSKNGRFSSTAPGWAHSPGASSARLRRSLIVSASALVALGVVVWLALRPAPVARGVAPEVTTEAHPPAVAAASAAASELAPPNPPPPVAEAREEQPSGDASAKATAPRSSAAPQASGHPPSLGIESSEDASRTVKESKPVVKTAPVRPATERDRNNSVWAR
jgi:serine/threonine protein kinase